jgi:two-component system, chemotaxis family, sensor kinase Cph1
MIENAVKNLQQKAVVCDSNCVSAKSAAHHVNASLGDQVLTFFSKIFNTADWPPRWHCGSWSDFHGWLYIISDLAIWAAYFAIPVLLFRIVIKRKDILPFSKIFWLFIAFIMLCGTTHLIDAIIFWWPAYRLSALIRFATAVISIFTVYALFKMLPTIFNLRTLEQLEAEIEERKKAEQEARNQQVLAEAAKELMAKKDEFMSIASHELKTPITIVKTSLQLLRRMTDKNESLQHVTPFITKSEKQVNKLTGIVNDLLDVTRIHAGKLELVKSNFSLLDLVNECIENCLTDNESYSIKVNCDTDLAVYADRNRIEQVLSNILTNAIKYSPKNKVITLTFGKDEYGKARIAIADNGIGIPQEKMSNVFDRFFRVENTSQYFSGVGLGLYISSEIVKQHEGQIGVSSVYGEGSTFWFAI